MATFAAWTRLGSDRPAKAHRCYEVLGPDAVIRADCLAEITARVGPAVVSRVSAQDVSPERVWDEITATPFGSGSRLVVVSDAEHLRWWDPLRPWLADRARHAGTTVVFLSGRSERGKRRRNRNTGKWETELADWQRWVDASTAAIVIECPALSIETVGATRTPAPSQAACWLSLRVPVTQRQAEYLWRRVGGSTALARDVLEQLRLLGLADASRVGERDFASYVDEVVLPQGADGFVEDLLFDRRSAVVQSVRECEPDGAEWSRVIGLLTQRLEWLAPLHHALGTKESLSTVSHRLGINEKWILHYAHREDHTHNIARHYPPRRVAACRSLLADLDAALAVGRGVPVGFGEVLAASW